MKGFLQRILQEIMKKIILGTSDAWSMRQSTERPSNPAYYIEDCWISGGCGWQINLLLCISWARQIKACDLICLLDFCFRILVVSVLSKSPGLIFQIDFDTQCGTSHTYFIGDSWCLPIYKLTLSLETGIWMKENIIRQE